MTKTERILVALHPRGRELSCKELAIRAECSSRSAWTILDTLWARRWVSRRGKGAQRRYRLTALGERKCSPPTP